ncbi:hypothetical protein [Paenibacillus daejeonensis]|uniref:hypothetical protein n=1 Tax=Paenibacillus daejeonensis TaxID=135193 RepID=UPI0003A14B80|nr:hypothetical protein [Paenibacillus daejeonensis]
MAVSEEIDGTLNSHLQFTKRRLGLIMGEDPAPTPASHTKVLRELEWVGGIIER